MVAEPDPSAVVTEFVESVRSRRRDAGQPDHITDPAVYNILDGIMAGKRETALTDSQRAGQRRRAAARSKQRVPYE